MDAYVLFFFKVGMNIVRIGYLLVLLRYLFCIYDVYDEKRSRTRRENEILTATKVRLRL